MIDPPAPSEIVAMRQNLAYRDPQNPWVSVYFDDVQWPDGRWGRYNRIVEGTGRPGVAILPILPAGIGLVRIDRYPVGLKLWEIPRGFGEGLDPEQDAHRELTEETGWVASEMIPLGKVCLNSGLLAGNVVIYAAIVEVTEGDSRDTEATEVSIFPLRQVREAIKEKALTDAATAAALLFAEVQGLLDLTH